MSPLYLYNGQLLVVDGKLAIGQNCCCDEATPEPSAVPLVIEPAPEEQPPE